MERLTKSKIDSHYDMIIIGGGITGASVAYEASSRGLKVALFEKGDFGEATSAATSKLIHGGLRYLKNMEFGLVRESLNERRTLENIAPNFVYPIPFMIPTYRNLKNNRSVLTMGMVLYDILSYDKGFTWDPSKKLPIHKNIGKNKTSHLEPFIKTKKLTGSSIFYDCQNINPERLTLSMIKSAIHHGAEVANYSKVESFIKEDNIIKGVNIYDSITNTSYKANSDIVINCTGPWSDFILNNASKGEGNNHHIRRSEGIHIITKKLCQNHTISLMTESGRHLLFIPWRGHTIIGTTDKTYHGNPDEYAVSKQSIVELLEEINQIYGEEKIAYDDILFAYGGMRPLVDNQTEGSYSSSRKYEINDNTKDGLDGLISVEGGKYTTSRKLADQLLKVVAKKWKKDLGSSKTDKNFLKDSAIKDMTAFIIDLEEKYPLFSKETVHYLGANYGEKCHEIFKLAIANKELQEVVSADGEILAEVTYVIKNEMVYTLDDVLFRRTGIGTLGYPGDRIFDLVVKKAKTLLKWDDEKTQKEINKVMAMFKLPE
ncbi:MAG: glycerol-3-phosphate dehydrogenase/oxidase [Bacteroidales bacterium]|nr:glycerol-3-phosphate dehydrogenase/oxidase [Bacteroidales bacterium]